MALQKSVFQIKFSKILKIFEKTTLPFFRWGKRNTFYFVNFPHTNPPNPPWYDLFRLSHSLKNKTLTGAVAKAGEAVGSAPRNDGVSRELKVGNLFTNCILDLIDQKCTVDALR